MKKRILISMLSFVLITGCFGMIGCGIGSNGKHNIDDVTSDISASFEYANVSGKIGYLAESEFDGNFDEEDISKLNLMKELSFENGEACYMVIDMTITTKVENNGGYNIDLLTEISNRAVIRQNIERAPTAKIDQRLASGVSTISTTYSILPKLGDEKSVFMIIELMPISSGNIDISLSAESEKASHELYTTSATVNTTELYYTINDDGTSYTVTGMSDTNASSVTVPETLRDGLPVTGVGDEAFYNCTALCNITLPNGITSIGMNAFDGTAYYADKNNWEERWENGFKRRYLYVGDYLIAIGEKDFTAYTISENTKCIAADVFNNCENLTEINLDENNTSFKIVEGGLYTSDGKILVRYFDREKTEFTILDTVRTIYGCAFYECKNLTSITVPESVISIGSFAFFNCSELTSITIPKSIKSIKKATFHECWRLTSISIPNGVTSIGDSAFLYCAGATSITIPDSVTSIGEKAFYTCDSLTEITIPNSVKSIGELAFCGCNSLESITLPLVSSEMYLGYLFGASSYEDNPDYVPNSLSSVTITAGSIGDYALYDCSSLTSVTVSEGVTSIGKYAFSGCTGMEKITILEGVTSIGSYAFYECCSLTDITIPDSLTSIGDHAFEQCGFESVDIGNGVKNIGAYAFYNCADLCKLTISSSVEEIGNCALTWCFALNEINYRGTEKEWNSITKASDWDEYSGDYAITYNYSE